MATFPSRQKKGQDWVDPMLVFISTALLIILIVFGPLNGNMYSSVPRALVMGGGATDHVSGSVGVSFTSDLQYWNANCNHGWTSDFMCEALLSRTQWCLLGVGSTYCSEYEAYLQQIRNQQNRFSF